MGGYTNILNRKTRVPSQIFGLALMVALSLSAAPSLAGSPAALAPIREAAVVPNPGPRSVEAQSVSSESHTAQSTTSPSATARANPSAVASQPLTRAAAQLRIDEMSPVGWLRHFGSVSIGQRD